MSARTELFPVNRMADTEYFEKRKKNSDSGEEERRATIFTSEKATLFSTSWVVGRLYIYIEAIYHHSSEPTHIDWSSQINTN